MNNIQATKIDKYRKFPENTIQQLDTGKEEIQDEPELGTKEYFDRHDCYDAIGGDWEG